MDFLAGIEYLCFMTAKEKHWYQKQKLKHITAFLSSSKKQQLKKLAKDNNDMTLTRYVTLLLEKHLKEQIKG